MNFELISHLASDFVAKKISRKTFIKKASLLLGSTSFALDALARIDSTMRPDEGSVGLKEPNPFIIDYRPFAVEPVTGIMFPDGVFDATLGRLDIKFFIRNTSNENFTNIQYDLEQVTPRDFDIVGKKSGVIRDFKAGASVLVHIEADFTKAAPGEKELLIWTSGDYAKYENKNHLKKIFVTKTLYDQNNKKYVCETPCGTFMQKYKKIFVSKELTIENPDYLGNPPQVFIPTDVETQLVSLKPIRGPFDCIPFEDPLALWKAIAWIVAAVASIGAFIAAKKGKGTASIGITADETEEGYKLCKPSYNDASFDENTTLAGSLSIVANAAILVGMKHKKDPWVLGRESAGLSSNEYIQSEKVDFVLSPQFPIKAGFPYQVEIDWEYNAETNQGNSINLNKSETVLNKDIVAGAFVTAPAEVIGLNEIVVGLKVLKSSNPEEVFGSNEIYSYCLLVSPSPLRKTFKIELQDNGTGFDEVQNDGWFKGGVVLENLLEELRSEEIHGEWTAYFFAQLVNLTPDGASAEESAKHIGGTFLVHPNMVDDVPEFECPAEEIDGIYKFIKKILVKIF